MELIQYFMDMLLVFQLILRVNHDIIQVGRIEVVQVVKESKYIWDVLWMYWINMYLGPPDLVIHNIGKNFISKEFKQYVSTMGINMKGVPVKAYNSIGMVE